MASRFVTISQSVNRSSPFHTLSVNTDKRTWNQWYTGISMVAREPTAKERVRDRIVERLDDLRMKDGQFAIKMGHKAGWINAIRDGRNALQLEDLDRAAFHLRMTPGDLVRRSGELYELRPTESRLVIAIRLLPHVIQDYLVTLAEFLVGVFPEEVDFLHDYRELGEKQRTLIRHWTRVMRLGGGDAQDLPVLDDLPGSIAGSATAGYPPVKPRHRGPD